MFKKILTFVCAVMLVLGSAKADVDNSLVSKAEKYLNSITGLSGKFVQTVDGDDVQKGEFFMLRPGKLKLDYRDSLIEIISNGKELFFIDDSLDQITTIPMNSTPASILARKKIDLRNADISVIQTVQNSSSFDLKLILRDNPGLGEMNVSFAYPDAKILGWTLKDATGVNTEVEFQNLNVNTDFPKDFWDIKKQRVSSFNTGDDFYE